MSAKRLRFGHVREDGDVERQCLCGEMPDLLVGDPGEHAICGLYPQPVEVDKKLAHALRARPQRLRLDLIPARTRGSFGNDEQCGQALPHLWRHRRGDLAMIAAIDQGARRACDLEKRAEGRHFVALPDQLLDGDVDDVGEVVAGARRFDACADDNPASRPKS